MSTGLPRRARDHGIDIHAELLGRRARGDNPQFQARVIALEVREAGNKPAHREGRQRRYVEQPAGSLHSTTPRGSRHMACRFRDRYLPSRAPPADRLGHEPDRAKAPPPPLHDRCAQWRARMRGNGHVGGKRVASRNSRLPRLSCLALVDNAPAGCSDDLSSHSHLCRCDCGRTWHRSTGNDEEGDPRCRGRALVFAAADTTAGRATGSIPSVQGIAGGAFRWSRRAYGVRRRIRACWPILPLRVRRAFTPA
jgi:hypothetical protein